MNNSKLWYKIVMQIGRITYPLVEESFHPDSQQQGIPDSELMLDLALELA
jgi:hypothetical protein